MPQAVELKTYTKTYSLKNCSLLILNQLINKENHFRLWMSNSSHNQVQVYKLQIMDTSFKTKRSKTEEKGFIFRSTIPRKSKVDKFNYLPRCLYAK